MSTQVVKPNGTSVVENAAILQLTTPKMKRTLPFQTTKGKRKRYQWGVAVEQALEHRLAEIMCEDSFEPRTQTVKKGANKGQKFEIWEIPMHALSTKVLDGDGNPRSPRLSPVTFNVLRVRIS